MHVGTSFLEAKNGHLVNSFVMTKSSGKMRALCEKEFRAQAGIFIHIFTIRLQDF
jgi:hypothetical protein